jgi:hypothetical protein
MEKVSRLYIKYIIKSKVIFCAFLAVGIIGFLFMTMSLKLDLVKRYEAYFDNNKIVIQEELDDIDFLYAYKSLNERVYLFDVREIERVEQYTIIYVENEDENIKKNLLGIVRLEMVTGETSLFDLIYIRAGKKRDERET